MPLRAARSRLTTRLVRLVLPRQSPNVLVSEDFHAKIGDFGLAEANKNAERRWLKRGVAMTAASDASPMWAAPEARAGEEQTDRADVFSMCTVLCVE